MVRGLLVLVLVSLNLGGLFSVIMQFARHEWLPALGSIAFVIVLDAVGFWLLREMD